MAARFKESSRRRIFAAIESSPPLIFADKAILEITRLSSKEPDKENTDVKPENKPDELGVVKLRVIPPVKLYGIRVEEALKAESMLKPAE